jgi:DNA-binding MarR family transcriptional regulator
LGVKKALEVEKTHRTLAEEILSVLAPEEKSRFSETLQKLTRNLSGGKTGALPFNHPRRDR